MRCWHEGFAWPPPSGAGAVTINGVPSMALGHLTKSSTAPFGQSGLWTTSTKYHIPTSCWTIDRWTPVIDRVWSADDDRRYEPGRPDVGRGRSAGSSCHGLAKRLNAGNILVRCPVSIVEVGHLGRETLNRARIVTAVLVGLV
jgi:hypothetical protein